ncbi:hypothetical protein [Candidatus Regiella insecticola]|uniref:hypothetical protein n=1 Tax=Candidatus Regiella insecticola TaxID=138073 RepID=UPI00030A0711|nr:hypothetical protein [Candidatus Regiella insecticola]
MYWLGVLASGFDIYNAYRSFSQLAQTTDPAIRQDLMVNGSLSVLGAAVGIGVISTWSSMLKESWILAR